MRHFTKLFRDHRGATAIEYALVASLISIAAITAFNGLGDRVDAKFGTVNTALGQVI